MAGVLKLEPKCSFCLKPLWRVRKLMHNAERTAFICTVCVLSCRELIIAETSGPKPIERQSR